MAQQKLHSFINIGGLALGIALFLLITTYVNREMNYDNFHKDKKNIYRVYRVEDEPSGRISSAATPHALPRALENDFPEIKNVVSIISTGDGEIKAGENKFHERILSASANFFDMFDFPFEIGNYKQLNENINSIILTSQLAKKLFGNESPLGKTVTLQGQLNFIVSGILKNIPSNSSFQFDAFVSIKTLYHYVLPGEEEKWYSMGVETFVEFSAKLTPEYLKSQFPQFLNKYLPDYLKGRLELNLQPLRDIHTDTNIESYIAPPVSKISLLIFFLIACTILGIASINFINLVSAKQSERDKEICVRKVVGASRVQLAYQFLIESILMTFIATVLGLVLLEIILPYFNTYIQPPLSSDLFNRPSFFAFALLFALLLGSIHGLYPALLLSASKSAAILRKENRNLFGRIRSRHLLITVQFGITIALIFGVFSIYAQVSFMKNHDLGFLSENLVAISTDTNPTMNPDDEKIKLYTEMLQNEGQNHGIISAAFSENVPGSYYPNQFSIIPEGGTDADKKEMVITRSVNQDFLNTYQMKIVEGRNFLNTMSSDHDQAAIINETAAKMFGWKNPIGKQFHFAFDPNLFTVIGVVNDFHFRSMQSKIEPLVFIECWGHKNFVTARIRSDGTPQSIAYLRQEWTKLMPAFPFEYHFVKDMYRESYKAEERVLKAILTFAVLAIILASLGLLGLTALTAVRRTKEIGIRKTLGASVANIVFLMSRELMFWVIVANIIAQPVAYYFVIRWLQNFPYRIELTWWMFALSGGAALLIALTSVSFQAIKAATANPVESLRYE
jgi:putative ABC transport system permease protein